jgi:thiol-disulfide isomerase/thioredoxin
MSATASGEKPTRRRLLVLLPLLLFLLLAALFFFRLGSGDPSRIPSALIGRPAPETNMAPVPGLLTRDGKQMPGIQAADFKGAVTLVNVWASWCVPCHDEAPFLNTLSEDKRIRLVGINYKDQPDNARRFPRPPRQSLRCRRRRRQRTRLDGMGRLRRAGNLPGRPRRQDRLQADRPDHRDQPRARAQARDREGALSLTSS